MARLPALLACGLGAVLYSACSPFGGGAFECSLDTQCGAGKCADGFCSFPDATCPSGYRYGEVSGPNSNQCVGATSIDGGIEDMTIVPDDSRSCYGTGLVTACFTAPPTGAVVIDTSFDTMTSAQCDQDPGNAAWCVIAAQSITIQNTVRVTGARPLVLVATGTITVQGALDIASHRTPGQVGAGANPSACNAGTAPGTSGGGAGGSFGGTGGNGGGGGGQGGTAGIAGAGSATPATLRGGCRGQDGNGSNAGTGASGGGAVYLIAEVAINNSGVINASGAGATAGTLNASGGGGGGSGGFIGLDAPSVMNSVMIVANGGGGGEGSGSTTPGNPGLDPTSTLAANGGGGNSTNGGDGGDGAAGATLTGDPAVTGNAGGGGGGGGAGIVRLDRAAQIGGGGLLSPPAT